VVGLEVIVRVGLRVVEGRRQGREGRPGTGRC
jgi:hypothetical protein